MAIGADKQALVIWNLLQGRFDSIEHVVGLDTWSQPSRDTIIGTAGLPGSALLLTIIHGPNVVC